jgi:3-oxoacyl-[acyl-carrier-protein] synthase-3
MKIHLSSLALLPLFIGSSQAAAFMPRQRGSVGAKKLSTALDMASSGELRCRPIGIGSAAPQTVISNVDLESVVETSDEWIRSRTGISSRRVLLHDESIKSLGAQAAEQALEMSGVAPEDIDLIICATSSPDDMFGDATSIAATLGCTTATVAFDLTAACSGFLFGTVTAGQFLSTPGTKFKNAIVIGADALSRWVDWDDRNSCILFGDGAGAMVLTNEGMEDSKPGLLGFAVHSNGEGYLNLNCG